MKRYLPFIIVAAVGLGTIGGATGLYRAKRGAQLRLPADAGLAADPEHAHSLGNPKAPVVLEEFGDYQCPPCGTLAGPLNQFVRDFPDLRLVFRNYPLPMHQHAHIAALAAEAAGMQGHFWEMHDLLFKEQAVWGPAPNVDNLFNAYASMLHLDVSRFQKDMASSAAMQRIETDQHRGAKLGVTLTPTIFLNNQAIPSASLNPNGLRAAIEVITKKSAGSSASIQESPSPK